MKRPKTEVMKKKVRFGIKFKFFLHIITIIGFISVTLVFFFVTSAREELIKEIEKRGIAEAKSLAYDVKYGILTEDEVILEQLVSGRMKKPDVVCIKIIEENNRVLTKNWMEGYDILYDDNTSQIELEKGVFKSSLRSKEGEIVFAFIAPILANEVMSTEKEALLEDIIILDEEEKPRPLPAQRGLVKVALSLKNVDKKMAEITARSISLISIIAVISVIASFFFVNLLMRPITKVTQTAHEISEGDLEKVVDVRSKDEVGIMAISFNKMTNSLKNTIMELEELKDSLEQKVKDRTEDLVAANLHLTEANETLRKLDEMKTSFISMVSHEIRTPLTSILGFANLMYLSYLKDVEPKLSLLDKLDSVDGDKKKFKEGIVKANKKVEIIIKEGERLTRLINDALDITKMESGKMEWHDNEISLVETVKYGIDCVSSLAEEKGLKISLESHGEIPDVYCDKDKIMQVIGNILSNAIKFTDQGKIMCSIQNKGKEIEVKVADSGFGISKEELPAIFEKFKQLGNPHTDKPKGTGLGLAICKEIVEHYGGNIWAESELGKGCSVMFTIPV